MQPQTTTQTPSQNRVPFLNLRSLFETHREEFLNAMVRVLEDCSFIEGRALEIFEKNFAQWVSPGSYAVGAGNGTDAITLAIKALRLPPDSEVIIPAMTFVATAAGIRTAGLRVKLIDIDSETLLMDPEQIEAAITPSTRAIAPVHLYGQMAPMDRIKQIAEQHRLKILEDAAQAHGARWKGKPVGHWGDIATYSFYPGKNLGAFGDGGAILSRDAELIRYCSALGKHGGLKKYQHDYVGHNSRLDTLQAAILDVKLKYIDEWNRKRREVAGQYRKNLAGIEGLKLPVEHPDAIHVYHLYVVRVENRDKFSEYLKARGIDTVAHYPKAIHELPSFKNEPFAKQSFPNAEKLAANCISLPMCPTLTIQQIEMVCSAVHDYFEGK